MKINNPTKFFQDLEENIENNSSNEKYKATLVSRGDIIKLYAETDSINPSDWHFEPTETDKWWKMSFDFGKTYPIHMRMSYDVDDIISMNFPINDAWEANTGLRFDISENYKTLKERGRVSVFEVDSSGYLTENRDFKYKFEDVTDTTGQFVINFNSAPILEDAFVSGNILIKVGGDIQIAAPEKQVYKTSISSIPSVNDSNYGICSYLDSNIDSIECLPRLLNVKKIRLKVVSADELYGGQVLLKFKCGEWTLEKVIDVTRFETYVDIDVIPPRSGSLSITRKWEAGADTLKVNDELISLIITEIIVETE